MYLNINMETVCNPSINIENLKKFLKVNTGVNIKLSREELCDAYAFIESGKLPLPPLVMSRDRTYLTDKRSPLTHGDYNLFFSSTALRKDLERLARKVDIKTVGKLTKEQLRERIGNRLVTMGVREPIQIGKRRVVRALPINNVTNSEFNFNDPNLSLNNGENVKMINNGRNLNNSKNFNINTKNNIQNFNTKNNVQNFNTNNNVQNTKRKPAFPNNIYAGTKAPQFITKERKPSLFFKSTPQFILDARKKPAVNYVERLNVSRNLKRNNAGVNNSKNLVNFMKQKEVNNKENNKKRANEEATVKTSTADNLARLPPYLVPIKSGTV